MRTLLLIAGALVAAGCGSASGAATPHVSSERLAKCVAAPTDGDSAAWRSSTVFVDWMTGDHLVARLEAGRWRASWKPASAARRHGAVFARCSKRS